jgi:hypothetical protein
MLNNLIEFIHEPLNTPVQAIGGQYMFIQEVLMPYKGLRIFYLKGCALFDNTCCGTGGVGYALVPGYIVQWKKGENDIGKKFSVLLPITDKEVQKEIESIIIEKEKVFQVQFY